MVIGTAVLPYWSEHMYITKTNKGICIQLQLQYKEKKDMHITGELVTLGRVITL